MTSPETPEHNTPEHKGARIAKHLSRAGLCSRREAERWIEAGRVAVNGVKLDSPVMLVTDKDVISVDGKPISEKQETRLWRYHKPAGLVTSHADEQGRQTVFESLPPDMPRVISIGRLDLNTEGLLLLTNDGELSRHLEHPDTGWRRRYRVRVYGEVTPEKLRILKKGITYRGIDAKLESESGANSWLTVTLTEGKNREVRNAMESIDLKVNRLIRIAYGPFQLGNLPVSGVEEVPRRALKSSIDKKFWQRKK